MSDDDSATPARRFRFTRFSLTTIFILMTAVAVGIAVGIEASKSEVVATLQVRRNVDVLWTPGPSEKISDEDYRRFCQTQIELLRSELVLTRALRDPAVSRLGVAQQQANTIKWLRDNLKIDMAKDSELLRIRLYCRYPDDGVTLVTAVVDAYFREIVDVKLKEENSHEQRLKRLCEEKNMQISRERRDIAQVAEAVSADPGKVDELW